MARAKKEKVDINEIKSRRIDSRPFSEISDLKIHRVDESMPPVQRAT